ncbi:3-oxoacyl-ACP synthase [Alkalibacillus haloalkaliphilus]|uniref:3-oxoacyl-[acyl-carrier-protein] synthase 3 n=1 Tax=Alkalibacillus haloalkaliphilus TaxID=94136 RepID=A0A511W370_9BACI|nr:3-oxoacyl-ACP synthase [Alkalibacillus haloalkaliphilus]GEN44798.1 3-oxoacyl-[acyl-carrier-protein] synthase 3 [Alkalibacillus haloalkaliphilus]
MDSIVGVVATGIYIPKERMTGEEIANKSQLPVDVVKEKMGIQEKPIPGLEDHTAEMGIKAARQAFEKCDVKPEEIDLIIYIGEEYKEYPLWTASIKMQEELGCDRAWAFDVALRCGTTIMALKVAKALMVADTNIKTVLLAGGYRNGDFIDFENPRTRFMYNLSAGGGAIILKENYERNQLHETSIITDGSFSEDVVVVGGGTKLPMSKEVLESNYYQLDVLDPDGMKSRLEEKSMKNFLNVIREALSRSSFTEEDIDYLAILHMKRSAHQYILDELGLNDEQTIYLEHYGHIGQIDQILSLQLAQEQNKLKDGDVVVLVSAGIGYAWGASVIRWG